MPHKIPEKVGRRTAAVAARVRKLRQLRRLSVAELVESLNRAGVGISRAVLTNIELGRREDMTVEEFLGLADALNVNLNWLAYGEGAACAQCGGEPPPGFRCESCNAWSPVHAPTYSCGRCLDAPPPDLTCIRCGRRGEPRHDEGDKHYDDSDTRTRSGV